MGLVSCGARAPQGLEKGNNVKIRSVWGRTKKSTYFLYYEVQTKPELEIKFLMF